MKKIWYIYDGNEYCDGANYTKEELDDMLNTIKCESWSDVKKEAQSLIEDFYEISSQYGNPIAALFNYIPDNKIKDLLEEYNYYLKEEVE